MFNIVNEKEFEYYVDSNFLIIKYGYNISLNLSEITKMLEKELDNFKRIFVLYFEIFVFPFYNNLKSNKGFEIFSNIDKHYTFNYTPTFDELYSKNKITSFLHGEINKNNIVLGINEIPKISPDYTKLLLPFTKYFQRFNNRTDYNFLQTYKVKSLDFSFFFFGHSLEKSDEDYINEVFKFIKDVNGRRKIVIIYHNENSYSKLLINLLEILGKELVTELMREEILIFTLIDSFELNEELRKKTNDKPYHLF
jgi:hypothetical protein